MPLQQLTMQERRRLAREYEVMRELVLSDAPLEVRREQLADRSVANVVCRQADWQRAERVVLMREQISC
jgi:hypothetical protein